jgi:hypothetical protein
MYARKRRLAIDGKAMYFRGGERSSDVRLRPSNAREISHESSRIHTDKAKKHIKILIRENP